MIIINEQKLIDDLKKQVESNNNYIKELQISCGSNFVLINELYGNLIANLNGKNAICEILIKDILKGIYDKEYEFEEMKRR